MTKLHALGACVLLFSGCGTEGLDPAGPEPTVGEVVPGVISRFTAPDSVRLQDSTAFRLVLQNAADTTAALRLRGGVRMSGAVEFRVEDATGALVFSSAHGLVQIMVGPGIHQLEPGDSLSFSFPWGLEQSSSEMEMPPWAIGNYQGPYLSPGEYRVWPVVWLGDDPRHLPKRRLTVLPRR